MAKIFVTAIMAFLLLGTAGTGAALAGGGGAEHTSNKSPSTLNKHQEAQAKKKNQADVKDWKAYKAKGGRQSKTAWEKGGKPKK